jgi:hypothetical protein
MKNTFFLLYDRKSLKLFEYFFLNKKYFGIKKKILHGFYNKFVKFHRIVTYISKVLNIYF